MFIFWDDSCSLQGHYHDTSCHWHWNFVNSCQTLVYVEWYLIQIKYDFQPSKPQHITELMYQGLHWTEWNKILFCTIKPLQLLFQCVAKLNNRPGNKCNHSISLKTSKLAASSNHWMSKTHTHTKISFIVNSETFSIRELSLDVEKSEKTQTFHIF